MKGNSAPLQLNPEFLLIFLCILFHIVSLSNHLSSFSCSLFFPILYRFSLQILFCLLFYSSFYSYIYLLYLPSFLSFFRPSFSSFFTLSCFILTFGLSSYFLSNLPLTANPFILSFLTFSSSLLYSFFPVSFLLVCPSSFHLFLLWRLLFCAFPSTSPSLLCSSSIFFLSLRPFGVLFSVPYIVFPLCFGSYIPTFFYLLLHTPISSVLFYLFPLVSLSFFLATPIADFQRNNFP